MECAYLPSITIYISLFLKAVPLHMIKSKSAEKNED